MVELAKSKPDSHPASMVWASVLGLDADRAPDDPHEVTARLQQIRREIDILEAAMRGTTFSSGLYAPYLENVRRMVSVPNISAGWSQYVHFGNAETLLALRYCAEILESEEAISHEDMQALLDEIHQFRTDITERDISAAAKEFLLHQLAIMEEGIQGYPIQGGRIIKDAFKRGVGDAVTVEESVMHEAGTEQISRLKKLWKGLQAGTKGVADLEKLASNIVSLLEKGSAIVESASKLLSHSGVS